MKYSALIIFGFCVLLCSESAGFPRRSAVPEYRVSDVKDLFAKIGSDRIVRLAPGTYDVRDALGIGSKWVEWSYGQPVLRHVSRFTLIGGEGVELVTGSDSGYILKMFDCSTVCLENIHFAHVKGGGADRGGALQIDDSRDIVIESCVFTRSGLAGVSAVNVAGLSVMRTVIMNCTQSALVLKGCRSWFFLACEFRGTRGDVFCLIEKSADVRFDRCLFSANTSRTLMFSIDVDSMDIHVSSSRFIDNEVPRFSDNRKLPQLTGVVSGGNLFDGNSVIE